MRTFPALTPDMAGLIHYPSMRLEELEILCRQLITLGQAEGHSPATLSFLLRVMARSQKARLQFKERTADNMFYSVWEIEASALEGVGSFQLLLTAAGSSLTIAIINDTILAASTLGKSSGACKLDCERSPSPDPSQHILIVRSNELHTWLAWTQDLDVTALCSYLCAHALVPGKVC